MIAIENDEITALYTGEMGIKEVQLGEETIYERPGSYFYLELKNEKETE